MLPLFVSFLPVGCIGFFSFVSTVSVVILILAIRMPIWKNLQAVTDIKENSEKSGRGNRFSKGNTKIRAAKNVVNDNLRHSDRGAGTSETIA